jgi:hypothetical protein
MTAELSDIVEEEIRHLGAIRQSQIVTLPDIVVLVHDLETARSIVDKLDEMRIHNNNTFGAPNGCANDQNRLMRRQKMAFRRSDSRVNLTTFHSFKGIEARTLIVVLRGTEHFVDPHLLYTALSRLKATTDTSYLTVVSNCQRF